MIPARWLEGWLHKLWGPVQTENVGALIHKAGKKVFLSSTDFLSTCHGDLYVLFNAAPLGMGYLQGKCRHSEVPSGSAF